MRSSLAILVLICGIAEVAIGQLCSWDNVGSGLSGGSSAPRVDCLIEWDDGTGPRLYAGGDFSVPTTGSVNIASWNGSSWSASLGVLDGVARSFADFDDGSGAALYVGGSFTSADGTPAQNIARWNGVAWSALGVELSGDVYALEVFDDGSGPALYAGGAFTWPGQSTETGIAKWDGTSWSSLGTGITTGNPPFGALGVRALKVFDDGTGAALYVGGGFRNAGGLTATNIVRWDGSAWSGLSNGIGGFIGFQLESVQSLEVFDDGSGPALIAGGRFDTVSGQAILNITRWDGTAWAPMAAGLGVQGDYVYALQVLNSGAGDRLLAAGDFSGFSNIAQWDGAAWSGVAGGVVGTVKALAVTSTGATDSLFAGGEITQAGGSPTDRLAELAAGTWLPVPGIKAFALDTSVEDMVVFNDGSGDDLYAVGSFAAAGATGVNHVARWDGTAWSSLGAGLGDTGQAAIVFDDGSGPALYVGGYFTTAGSTPANYIAKWDGSAWSSLGVGVNGPVLSLSVFDDGTGPALIVGGKFSSAGGLAAAGIARWDSSGWAAIGGGIFGTPEPFVAAIHSWDDGSGQKLYIGGLFTSVNGTAAASIAQWDGVSWSPLSGGVGGPTANCQEVLDLQAFNDGSGPALYAGGNFTSADGLAAQGIARWDGVNWSQVGAATSTPPICIFNGVTNLEVYDDSRGPALYACGALGGSFVLARWNGMGWWPLTSGQSSLISQTWSTLYTYDDGTGTALYAGGSFEDIEGTPFQHIARSSCSRSISITFTQTPNPGGAVSVHNANLMPGHEYLNIFSVTPCPAGAGSGPPGLFGLCGDPAFLFAQAALPLGTLPSHFIASDNYLSFGPLSPFILPTTIEAICLDITGGVLGPISEVTRALIN